MNKQQLIQKLKREQKELIDIASYYKETVEDLDFLRLQYMPIEIAKDYLISRIKLLELMNKRYTKRQLKRLKIVLKEINQNEVIITSYL